MRNSGTKKIALVTLVVAIVGLTVAFAMLSSNLNISGSAYVDPVKWGIYFDNLSTGKTFGSAILDENTKAEIMTDNNGARTKIGNMNVILKIPGDKVVYTVDLVNEGTIPVEIADIQKSDIEYDFITLKVTYTGTSDEVSIGDVIEAGKDGSPAIYNLTITINYDKDLVNELPSEALQIDFNYKLEFKQTDNSVNKTTTTKKPFEFPEVSGNLGDDVTFDYYKIDSKNYGIAIKGTGAMYENNNDSSYKEKCTLNDGTNYYCTMFDEIMVRAIEKLDTGNEKIDKALNSMVKMKIGGRTLEDMTGATLDSIKQMFTDESGDYKLNSEEADYVMMVYNSIPNLKSVTMNEGVTSIKRALFGFIFIDTFKIPNSVTSINDAFDNAHIDEFSLGTGVSILKSDSGIFMNGTFKRILIPEGITEIQNSAIQPASDSIEYIVIPSTVKIIANGAIPHSSIATNAVIVNETGEAFDWSSILLNGTGKSFITGEVTTNDGKTITISDSR